MRMIGQEFSHVVTGAEAQKIERHAHRVGASSPEPRSNHSDHERPFQG
jgi:hypothetical protein